MKEKWQEIYTEEQLKRLQNILIENLKVFIDVCNKLNLEYFVYGGTLLGTIKYKNIIPWDDDVDVAMTRENYVRFLNEAPKILPKEYVLQTPYNEKKTPYSYTKLRKKGTKYIEEFYNNLDIEKGIYIDIYPVDNIPNDEKLRKKQYDEARKWIYTYYFRQCLHIKFPIQIKKIKSTLGQIILYCLLHLIPQSYIIKKLDKSMTKYNDIKTDRKACLFSPNYNNIYVKLYPLEKRKFGNIDVMVPNCYDDHLKKRYGQYTRDLPAEKRIGHIPYEIEF